MRTLKDVAVDVSGALVVAQGLLAGGQPPPQLWRVVLRLLAQLLKESQRLPNDTGYPA